MSDGDITEGVALGELDRHRVERGRRLRLAVATSILTKPLSLVTPLITVPLFLKYLGDERYGLFRSVGSIGQWLSLSNAGLYLGLMNRLPECYVSGDHKLARRYISTQVVALGAIALGLMVLLSLGTPLLPWQRIFHPTDPRALGEIPWAVWTAGGLTAAGMLLSLPGTIYTAYQQIDRNNYWDAACKLVVLGAAVGVVFTPWGLVGAVIAALGGAVLVRACNTYCMFRFERPELRPRIAEFDARLLRSLLAQGVGFLVLTMSVVALYQTDILIISTRIGPRAVVGYAVLGQFFIAVMGLFMLVLAPMWPAYGEAIRRGDLPWIRRTLRWSLVLGCAMMGACAVGLLLCTGTVMQLLRHWAHSESVSVSRSLILAMSATFLLRVWVDCRSHVLNPAGVLRPQMVFFVAHAGLNLTICVIWAPYLQVEGVAWTTFLTGLITTGWGYPWLIRRFLRQAAAQDKSAPR